MLNRRFVTSKLRYTMDLSGWWDFIIDPEDRGELKEYYSDFPRIWQLMDNRAHPDRFLSRPRGYNNKGILDEYRRPKLMWHAAKQMFARLK